jgi:hypothetical protein
MHASTSVKAVSMVEKSGGVKAGAVSNEWA